MKPIILAALLFSLGAAPAHAATCAKPGNVSAFDVSGGVAFVVSRSYGDAAFMIPGAAFARDAGALQGTTQFSVDEVHYQYLTVPKAKFVPAAGKSSHAAILARHARAEHKFALQSGSPFSAYDDIGNRAKPPEKGNPAMLFKLWTLKDPKMPAGTSQYMLSTVVGDEVALLSAILPSAAHEQKVMAVLERFAASYRFLQSAAECPTGKQR